MQSDFLQKNEDNLSIQDIDNENNFINIAHESHAYDNIKEAKLEDITISHTLLDFGDTNLLNCKLIESSKSHEFQRESSHSKVMSKFDFQFYDDDVSLQKIPSTIASLETIDRNLDMPLFYYYPNEFSITHSIESSQVVDVLQSSFYDPIYAWLEE